MNQTPTVVVLNQLYDKLIQITDFNWLVGWKETQAKIINKTVIGYIYVTKTNYKDDSLLCQRRDSLNIITVITSLGKKDENHYKVISETEAIADFFMLKNNNNLDSTVNSMRINKIQYFPDPAGDSAIHYAVTDWLIDLI